MEEKWRDYDEVQGENPNPVEGGGRGSHHGVQTEVGAPGPGWFVLGPDMLRCGHCRVPVRNEAGGRGKRA